MKFNVSSLKMAFLTLCGVWATSCLQAQLTYGAKADLGLGWMPSHAVSPTTWDGTSFPAATVRGWAMQPGLGFQIGAWGRYNILRNFFTEAQLTYNQINGRSRFVLHNTDINHQPTGTTAKLSNMQSIHALSLPLLLGLRTNWADITGGIQVNAQLANVTKYAGDFFVEGTENHINTKAKGGPLNVFDMGLKAGLITGISNRFSIEASYYHGLTNIVGNHDPNTTLKVRQVTYGLRYCVGSLKRRR